MLIKEYRIPLPMTVEEYRIAQLYMIAKKSREESKVSFNILLLNCRLLVGKFQLNQLNHKLKILL